MRRLMCVLYLGGLVIAVPARAQSSSPYGSQPRLIPGIMETEDFDSGGEGVAYHDNDSANNGGEYRQEGVDLFAAGQDGAGGLYSVGWMESGEWLNYTVEVQKTGVYELKIRGNLEDYQEANPTGFSIYLDGAPITGEIETSTFETYRGYFGWQGYSSLPKPEDPPLLVSLNQGRHTLRIQITQGGGGGLNYLIFQPGDTGGYSTLSYPAPGSGPEHYVSPVGNDANPGTLAQPWKTLGKAAGTAQAGDTVYIRSGTYNERLVPQHSGTVGNYLIFMAYPGESPIISGANLNFPQLEGVVHLEGKSFVQVSGFQIRDAPRYWNFGVSIDNSDHIIVDHNLVNNIYSIGISTSRGSHQVLIDYNTLTNTNTGADDGEVSLGTYWYSYDVDISHNTVHSSQGEGIGVAAGPNYVRVHNNTVYNMGLGRAGIGIYIDAWTERQHHIEVYNNVVRDNPSDGISVSNEAAGLLEQVRIYNNLLYNTGFNGQIGVTNWSNTFASVHTLKNIYVYQNTIGSGLGGGIFINNPQVINVVVKNNIMSSGWCGYQSYQTDGVCLENFRSDLCSGTGCNLYRSQIDEQLTAAHNLYNTDPRFVDPGQRNYHLQAGSAAINTADDEIDAAQGVLAPSFDFDGHSRPVAGSYDLGAYEYGSTSVPGDLTGDNKVNLPDLTQAILTMSINVYNLVVANYGHQN